MSPLAIIATQMQMEVAREVIANPSDPRYEWALRFIEVYGKSGRRAIRSERGLTHEATAGRQKDADRRRIRARVLAREGWTVDAIRYEIAVEEGRPNEPFHHRTVQRWLKRGGISTP
jgi:transposase